MKSMGFTRRIQWSSLGSVDGDGEGVVMEVGRITELRSTASGR
jgi:hypothetical protein